MSDWELFTESPDAAIEYEKYVKQQTSEGLLTLTFEEWLDMEECKNLYEEYLQDMADEAYERNFERGND